MNQKRAERRAQRLLDVNLKLLKVRNDLIELQCIEKTLKDCKFLLENPSKFKRGEFVKATIPQHGTFDAVITKITLTGPDRYADIEISGAYRNQYSGTKLSQMHFHQIPFSYLTKLPKTPSILKIPPRIQLLALIQSSNDENLPELPSQ